MKIGKYIFRAVIFLIVAVVLGAVLYLYPTWKAAKTLRDSMGQSYSSFELEIELDQDRLPEDQEKMIRMLARLTGVQEEAMYQLSIKGSAVEDKMHLLIYPEGRQEPLVEFYVSNDISVINETMLYNAIRGNLTGQFGLLEYLIPEQEENLYLTVEQVEQLFDIEISGLTKLKIPSLEENITTGGYFLMLAVMSREKQAEGYQFTLDTEALRMGFDVPSQRGDRTVQMRLQIENLGEVLETDNELLSSLKKRLLPLLGDYFSEKNLQSVKRLSLGLTRSEDGRITIPTNLASQETIETISKLRAWVQETFGQ